MNFPTHLFVQRDSALYLDFYKAADGSVREIERQEKARPSIFRFRWRIHGRTEGQDTLSAVDQAPE